MYKCKYCGKEFESKQRYAGHSINCEHNPKNQIDYICKFCSNKFNKVNGLHRHEKRCKNNPDRIYDTYSKSYVECNLYCKFCNKLCKNLNSLRQHEIRCKNNPDRIIPVDNFNHSKSSKSPWNKGLTKYSDERVMNYAKSISKKFKDNPDLVVLPDFSNPIIRNNLSVAMKKVYSSKLPKCKGLGKHGWYKGIWCDSSWELAWVIYSIEHKLNFVRNNKGFTYSWNNSEHTYFPDFYLPDTDEYVEIKGWFKPRDKAKLEQFPNKYILLKSAEMKPILEYVIDKYGENFYTLYSSTKYMGD